ncbi:MAG: serine hydrolase, partial [Acidobacteria bacterium]|nr:serine hydrolase [Acidobacteriota bacterium]
MNLNLIVNLKIKLIVLFSICVYLYLSAVTISAQGLPLAAPQAVGMSAEKLNRVDALVEKDIADKKLPGAVVVVGHKGKIVFRKAYGNRALVPAIEKMTVDTIFDVASLTKVVATTTSVMILVERGQIRLNDTIGKFIPEIEDEAVKKVTVQQLLTHTSGFAPDFDLREKWTGRSGMLAALYKEKLRQPAGTKFVYSDIGFIVLGEIVQRVVGSEKPVKVGNYPAVRVKGSEFSPFVSMNLFEPLLMNNTHFFITEFGNQGFYLPDTPKNISKKKLGLALFAPTENIKGQNNYLGSKFEGDDKSGNEILRGQVHDPTAFRMGGVAGHAGLFSTGDDLARYCQMLLNGGILDGKRILSAQTVARMTAPFVVSEDGATRGLGWDMNTAFSSNRGELFPLGS